MSSLYSNSGFVYKYIVIFLQDCHATSNAAPILDEQEDVKLLWGKQNGTHTCLRFRRAWDTCDHQDMALGVRLDWNPVVYELHLIDNP